MKKIVLTGGGTAGHVTPNIAIMDELKNYEYKVFYIGQKNSIEEKLISDLSEDIPFFRIRAGKLRRNANIRETLKNASDGVKVVIGFVGARNVLKKINPDVVFSKGGYVAVPVVLAAKMLKIPVVLHESDITPGLTNRITMNFAENICVSFKETSQYIKKNYNRDSIMTGTPVRKDITKGNRNEGINLCNFKNTEKPTILVIGGSQGSEAINEVVRKAVLEGRLDDFNIILIAGLKGEETNITRHNFKQFGYVTSELKHLYTYSDYIVSRAGANTIFEILELKRPNILIPLSRKVSRGDQIENAASFEKEGYSLLLEEENLTVDEFVKNIDELVEYSDVFISNMASSTVKDAARKIVRVVNASYGIEKEA